MRGRCAPGRLALFAALVGAAAAPARAQDLGHRWDVAVETAKASVGDPVTVRFHISLHERDLLSDTVPRPPDSLPDGVRVLEVGMLKRGADRTLSGRAKLAFYRPGTQRVPSFTLPFVRVTANLRGNLVSDSTVAVEIVPTLPVGNPPLRDIKPIERAGGLPWWWPYPLGVIAALGLCGWLIRRLRRRREAVPVSAAPGAEAPEPVVLGAYEIALARLAQAEREHWRARGDVARHYDAVADALRRYLEEAEGVPALERTTAELVWALPPRLSDGGLRDAAADFFAEADLVKFARVRPDEVSAARFVRAARALLQRWHGAAGNAPEVADAVR